jgi:hypothetical protein
MKNKSNQELKNDKTPTLSHLRKLATTKRLKFIFENHIESESIPSVRKAWIEYFIEIKNKKNLL